MNDRRNRRWGWVGLFALSTACNGMGPTEGPSRGVRAGGDAGPNAPAGNTSDDGEGEAPGAGLEGETVSTGQGPNVDPTSTPPGTDPTTSPMGTDVAPSPSLGDESGPGAVPPGADPGGVDVECGSEPGISPLMRLSTLQYKNTVRDLLAQVGLGAITQEIEAPLSSVPDDSLGDSFRSLDGRLSGEHVDGYFGVGIAVGDRIAADSELLETVAGSCALADPLTDDCAREFLERFLTLAYRRPASDDEINELLALRTDRSAAEAVRAMVVVALSSPRFINHFEIDGTVSSDSADVLQLTSYEIAARLSYTFWQTMPDAELTNAASDGSLATQDGFETQLKRVFADPRTRQTLWQFWSEWLRFEKFTGFETSRPAFAALSAGTAIAEEGHDYYGDMVQEIHDLTDLFTFQQPASVADLITTNISVTRSPDLAALYGVEPWDGSSAYPTLPEGTRGGLFQRAALLVSNLEQTNPFHRGAFVRRQLLCDPLPQPAPNSLPPGSLDPPPNDATLTTRQRFDAKVAGNGLCEGCHGSFSDIGYILESFDALGRHRNVETVYDEQTGDFIAELTLDTSGVARVEADDEAVVQDAIALNERLSASGKVESCLASRYFNYTQRRQLDSTSSDACVVSDLATLLKDPTQGLAGAFERIARHDTFFQRKVGPR